MSCTIDNIDRRGCIDIVKNVQQNLIYGFEPTFENGDPFPLATNWELILKGRNQEILQTYNLTPDSNGIIFWTAPKEDFVNTIMYYVLHPVGGADNQWLEIYGKITTDERK